MFAKQGLVSIALFLILYGVGTSYGDIPTPKMHALGAEDSLERIDVEVFYYLPNDCTPLKDWNARIEYLMRRAQKFHRREFSGQSIFTYTIHAEPFIASATHAGFPQDDVNNFYWHMINEVWHSDRLDFQEGAFPIILLFTDHNFSPGYDDWTRECTGKDCFLPEPHSDCAGYVSPEGEDRPGSRCGGARAVFWPEKHIGLGLVTADGWRVPIKGSDCVVYHEGIGHSIGLPHPEPINDSVMGLAQYMDGIHKTWIDDDQKVALGWQSSEIDRSDLFSTFSVAHTPQRPSATQAVQITATFPARFENCALQAEYQTGLHEPFQTIEPSVAEKKEDECHVSWTLKPIAQGQSIAYRVRILTPDGDMEEIWNYYKVR